MKSEFSVVIPLYNKEREIEATLRSVLGQTCAPCEIVVVDDGSTDGSLRVVESIESPLIRVERQANAGVAAARNHGVELARGQYIAFLDADDIWRPDYLRKMADMITRWPDCGTYSTAFDIMNNGNISHSQHPQHEGPLENFFKEAMYTYVCQPSATVIPRQVLLAEGGFPTGMKLGEDLYLWIKLADKYPMCFTPEPLVIYNRTASNRSHGIYTPEVTPYSFEDLYAPDTSNPWRNEYLARCAIGKALTLSAKGDTAFGLRTERFFAYTQLYRRGWHKLRILNRIPRSLRPAVHELYNRLAWTLARKGL